MTMTLGLQKPARETHVDAIGVKTNATNTELIRMAAQELPLDELLNALLARVVPSRHFQAMGRRLGWDGRGGVSLKEAARLPGVTRERIRQVEETTKMRLKVVTYFPALDRAIAVLDRAAGNLDFDAHVTLQRKRITEKPFLPRGVVTATEIFSKPRRFEIGPSPSAVHSPGMGSSEFSRALRSVCKIAHVSSVENLHIQVKDLVGEGVLIASTQRWLENNNLVEWLDDDHRWFLASKKGRLRYFTILRKMLSVSPVISSRSLLNGTRRYMRFRGQSCRIPLHVFEDLCRTAGLHVEDGVVSSLKPIDQNKALPDVERKMYQILKEDNDPITRKAFRAKCIAAGIKPNTFGTFLTISPIFERVSRGIYSLRDSDINLA